MSLKRDSARFKILDLWFYNDQEWIRFKDIKERTGIPERSLPRYLNQLVEEKVLDRDEEKGYRPFKGSIEQSLRQSLNLEKTREGMKIFYTEERKAEMAKKILIAHLDSAAGEIANIAMQVFEEKQSQAVMDVGELAGGWIDLFLADFYERLGKFGDYLLELYAKKLLGEKLDVLEFGRRLAMCTSSILRSYANVVLKIYQYSEPEEIINQIAKRLTKAVPREQIMVEFEQKYKDLVNKGIPSLLAKQILADLIWIPRHQIKIKTCIP